MSDFFLALTEVSGPIGPLVPNGAGDVAAEGAASANGVVVNLELVPVILTLMIGLLLLFAGWRILRSALAAAGLLVGGVAGWILGEFIGAGDVVLWTVAGIGGLMLCIAAVAAYRIAVGVGLGLTLGLLVPLGIWTAAEAGLVTVEQGTQLESDAPDQDGLPGEGETIEPGGEPGVETGEPDGSWPNTSGDQFPLPGDLREWLDDLIKAGKIAPSDVEHTEEGEIDQDAAREFLSERHLLPRDVAEEQFKKASEATKRVLDRLDAIWQRIPQELRPTMVIAGLAAAMLGFMIGALAATFGAGIVTAMGGAFICLSSGTVLAEHLAGPDQVWIPTGPMAWLITWLVLATLGVAIQFMFKSKPADTTDKD